MTAQTHTHSLHPSPHNNSTPKSTTAAESWDKEDLQRSIGRAVPLYANKKMGVTDRGSVLRNKMVPHAIESCMRRILGATIQPKSRKCCHVGCWVSHVFFFVLAFRGRRVGETPASAASSARLASAAAAASFRFALALSGSTSTSS